MNDCSNLVPNICGEKIKPKYVNAPCNNIRFTGITDITVLQGETVDLISGVHAYDGDGNEIAFRVLPPTIDTSRIGKYTAIYIASGVGDNFIPHMCGETAIHMTECNYGTARAYRTITVEPTDAVVCESKICESLVG